MNFRNDHTGDLDKRGDSDPLEKTYIEGNAERPSAPPPLMAVTSAKPAASSIDTSHTTRKADYRTITDPSMLPAGTEKIPLGSGTLAGLLGSGGMARVYKIWNEKLEVFRAVKILLPSRQKDLNDRFETEAKITAKLHHPNIVEIYNVGEWNSLPYLEMEFLDGLTLDSIICNYGKLPAIVCSAIGIFISRALVHAHSQKILIYGKTYNGVIHRDLKPANIMISSEGEVRLMDFGIARPTEASLHTVQGNIVGTMQYLSPEQIEGVDLDCRTDIYSFGAIMYEMITGMKTFPQNTLTSLMKYKIVNEYRKFSEFDFAIAPSLARIAQKCLHSSMGNRYSSATELLKELEAAHKLLTLDDPDLVVRNYMRDPANFTQTEQRKTLRLKTPKVYKLIVPLAVAIVLIAVVGGFLATIILKPPKDLDYPLKPAPLPKETTTVLTPLPRDTATAINNGTLTPLSPPNVAPETTRINPAGHRYPRLPKHPKPPVPPSVEVPPKPLTLVERLQQKYGTTDLIVIARNCIKAGRAPDAIAVLESEQEGLDQKLKALVLFEAYIETGSTSGALQIATNKELPDAQYDYLCGRLYHKLGRHQRALDYYENALIKRSEVRNAGEIRNDALYYSAIIRGELYLINPSSDNRIQSANAWNVVKRIYSDTPSHPRAIKAEHALSSLQ